MMMKWSATRTVCYSFAAGGWGGTNEFYVSEHKIVSTKIADSGGRIRPVTGIVADVAARDRSTRSPQQLSPHL